MNEQISAHPVAALFPMLSEDELQELAESIKSRGLEHPIVLDKDGRILDGRILDGRNRFAACALAGVEPRFTTFEGSDPDGYALDVNVARRHLSKGQKAMAYAMVHPNTQQGKKDEATSQIFGEVSREFLRQARAILKHQSELAPKVMAGDMPLNDAYQLALEAKRRAEERAAKTERLRAGAPDLLDKVSEGTLDIDEAIGAMEAREAKKRAVEAARRSAEQEAHHRRGIDIKRTLDDGIDSAARIHTQFAGHASAIVSAARILPEAIEYFGDRIAPAPLFSRNRLKLIKDALALLEKEFNLG